MHYIGGILGVLSGQVGETTMGGSHGVLVWRTLNRSLSRWGRSWWCSVLHRAVSDLVARLTTAEASEGHVAYGGRHSFLPRPRALSRVAQSGAVVVGGVGTTSMA